MVVMMSPERFSEERASDWGELDAALRRCGDRPERLGYEGVRRMGTLYRAAAADLAFARASWPADPLVRQLEALVLRGRSAVYGRAGRRASARAFFARGYWVRLAERPWILFTAWALLLVPALLGYIWARLDPASAAGLVPAEFQGAANPPAAGRDFDAATSSAFAVDVMTNNIQVTLLAFVGGITFGALTVWSLFFNGLLLGAVAGLAIGAGNGIAFLRLISSHGPLELSCIVVGGVAGLRMGWALIRPGPVRRATSLRRGGDPGRGARGRHGAVARGVRLLRGLPDGAGAAGRGSDDDRRLAVLAVLGARLLQRMARRFARR